MAPQRCPHLIPGTCEYVNLCGKRDSAGMIDLTILRWGGCSYLGWPQWAQCHQGSSWERGRSIRVSEEMWQQKHSSQRDRKMLHCRPWRWKGPRAKDCRQALESGKGSPRASRSCAALRHLDFRSSDLQSSKRINSCHFKLLSLWSYFTAATGN